MYWILLIFIKILNCLILFKEKKKWKILKIPKEISKKNRNINQKEIEKKTKNV